MAGISKIRLYINRDKHNEFVWVCLFFPAGHIQLIISLYMQQQLVWSVLLRIYSGWIHR